MDVYDVTKNPFFLRFKNIISDPINKLIERVEESGKIIDGNLIMYNGLKVIPGSYYSSFSDILIINKGVHEPQEEYVFDLVVKNIKDKSPVMLELGSYWAFYSMCFLKYNPDGTSYLIEPELDAIEIGKRHFNLNGFKGNFIKGKISSNDINIDSFVEINKIKKINILHSDIQGYEVDMLNGSKKCLSQNLIDYFFISTHDQKIHYQCLDILKNYNYKIIGSADFDNQTFCHDGVIIACSNNIDFSPIDLGDRSKSTIISDEDFIKITKKNYEL